LQNDFALYHAVAMKLMHTIKAALMDEYGEAQTCRLRCGKIVHRAFCQPNCGIRVYARDYRWGTNRAQTEIEKKVPGFIA